MTALRLISLTKPVLHRIGLHGAGKLTKLLKARKRLFRKCKQASKSRKTVINNKLKTPKHDI